MLTAVAESQKVFERKGWNLIHPGAQRGCISCSIIKSSKEISCREFSSWCSSGHLKAWFARKGKKQLRDLSSLLSTPSTPLKLCSSQSLVQSSMSYHCNSYFSLIVAEMAACQTAEGICVSTSESRGLVLLEQRQQAQPAAPFVLIS